ncbi:11964_t:CDS:2 [Funneliformis geosporum]|uniref:11964_t:CDS:1 n=1 Tax=Funneliformis geosporum TaxID=1117311 RepID=A0A9W4T144_9GLOM|nr:11964_t:CDS:2 [Funneliformis geosporum]
MENLASNISKLNLQNYNINNHNTIEEEYGIDFNNINEDLGNLINEIDMFEYSNTGLDYNYILDLDSNFDDESVIFMITNIINKMQPNKIPRLTKTKFTSCVLIYNINGEIRSCRSSKNLHCIKNIFGTWEIDNKMVHNIDGDLASLGVCYSHQMYDQTKLHILVDRNLQVPCSDQYYCTSLTNIHPILYPSLSNRKSQYIYTSCYEKHGRHFHQRSGIKGKFLYVAKYESPNFQAELFHEAINLLQLLPSQRFNNTS